MAITQNECKQNETSQNKKFGTGSVVFVNMYT